MVNLNYILTIVTSLSFIAEFSVNNDQQQYYFSFESKNNSAQLFRNNNTIFLWLNSGTTFEGYNVSAPKQKKFNFKWKDSSFSVDGEPMTRYRSNGYVNNYGYDSYSFFSFTAVKHEPDVKLATIEQVVACKDVNYVTLVLILLSMGLLIRSDHIIKYLYSLISHKLNLRTRDLINQTDL